MSPSRKILVTSALPYVNGSPHMGHLVEYIQTDIWVRFQKLRGHDCIYVCASDAHGTPIMLKARELGITPEELTEGYAAEFVRDFAPISASTSTTTTRPTRRRTRPSSARCSPSCVTRETSTRGRSSRCMTSRRACSCRTASSKAPARIARPRTSTAMHARTATRRPRRKR